MILKRENKEIETSYDPSRSVHERLYSTNTKKIRDYVLRLQKEHNSKNEDLSFRPKINNSVITNKRRSIGEFVKDMESFNDQK